MTLSLGSLKTLHFFGQNVYFGLVASHSLIFDSNLYITLSLKKIIKFDNAAFSAIILTSRVLSVK